MDPILIIDVRGVVKDVLIRAFLPALGLGRPGMWKDPPYDKSASCPHAPIPYRREGRRELTERPYP